MAKLSDKIIQIIEEQIDLVASKSKKSKLEKEEIESLRALAQTLVTVTEKVEPKRAYNRKSPGARMTDEDLLERAKED